MARFRLSSGADMHDQSIVARKIAADLGRLEQEARDAHLATLAYLLECARLEAENAAKGRS